MASMETVEIDPGNDVDGTVIWLHGLGADGHDFEPIVPELRLDDHASLRFVFPHAPVRPVTINGGMAMRAWYDILTLDRDGPQDEQGIRASAENLVSLIERERERGVPAKRIVLAGFSQGGAVALHVALRYPDPLAGLMALSTYLPLAATLDEEVVRNPAAQPRSLPVFMAHGTFDPVVPHALGAGSFDRLRATGYAGVWHEYPMAHSVCAEEVADIREWLIGVYGAAD